MKFNKALILAGIAIIFAACGKNNTTDPNAMYYNQNGGYYPPAGTPIPGGGGGGVYGGQPIYSGGNIIGYKTTQIFSNVSFYSSGVVYQIITNAVAMDKISVSPQAPYFSVASAGSCTGGFFNTPQLNGQYIPFNTNQVKLNGAVIAGTATAPAGGILTLTGNITPVQVNCFPGGHATSNGYYVNIGPYMPLVTIERCVNTNNAPMICP